MFALENLFKPSHRLCNRDVLAFVPRENFRDVKRLAEEALDFTRAINGQLILRRKFIHAEDGDNILQILVSL